MTTAIQDDLLSLLAAVADHDPLPSRVDDSEHIRQAIARSLAKYGEVHAAMVREFVTREVAPWLMGSVTRTWAAAHGEFVGYRPNGDTKSGNGTKPSPVWRAKS